MSHLVRRGLTVGCALLFVLLVESSTRAQNCQYIMQAYGDGTVDYAAGTYNATLLYWGGGEDYSTCSCFHDPHVEVVVVRAGDQALMGGVAEDAWETAGSVNVAPDLYYINTAVDVFCACDNNDMPTTYGGSPVVVELPTPTGETISFGNWDDTYSMWNQTLLPSTTDFSGRQVQEFVASAGFDSCHYEGSPFDPWTYVTNLVYGEPAWTVGAGNAWGPDYIGWSSNMIEHYRNAGSANGDGCGNTMYQNMKIYRPGGYVNYTMQTLEASFTNTTITGRRGDASPETINWP